MDGPLCLLHSEHVSSPPAFTEIPSQARDLRGSGLQPVSFATLWTESISTWTYVHSDAMCTASLGSHVGCIRSPSMRGGGWALGSCRPHTDSAGRPIPALLLKMEQKVVPHLSPHWLTPDNASQFRASPPGHSSWVGPGGAETLPPFCREQAHTGP